MCAGDSEILAAASVPRKGRQSTASWHNDLPQSSESALADSRFGYRFPRPYVIPCLDWPRIQPRGAYSIRGRIIPAHACHHHCWGGRCRSNYPSSLTSMRCKSFGISGSALPGSDERRIHVHLACLRVKCHWAFFDSSGAVSQMQESLW
jgi:hypothetical protein